MPERCWLPLVGGVSRCLCVYVHVFWQSCQDQHLPRVTEPPPILSRKNNIAERTRCCEGTIG